MSSGFFIVDVEEQRGYAGHTSSWCFPVEEIVLIPCTLTGSINGQPKQYFKAISIWYSQKIEHEIGLAT